jgi:hypothetical protein
MPSIEKMLNGMQKKMVKMEEKRNKTMLETIIFQNI